jgi:peptidyl-prolyl cis-trans isomerase SurA
MKLAANIFLFLSLTAFHLAAEEPMVVDAVAADVGGRRITFSDVMEEARNIISSEGAVTPTVLREKIAGAYAEALTNLITRQLILIRYDQAKQKLPNWMLSRRVETIIDERFGGDRSLLVSMLANLGLSYEKWRKNIEEDFIVNMMRSQFVDQGIVIKPDDLLAIYEREYANRKLSGPVRAALILLRPMEGQSTEAAVSNAVVLARDLRAGKDFAATARRISKDPHAADGGDWGYIDPAEEFRKELADALAALKPGEVSDPVVIGADYIYILKKVDESQDLSIPFDSVRDEIERDIRADAGLVRFDAWIESLKKTTTIRLYKPTL